MTSTVASLAKRPLRIGMIGGGTVGGGVYEIIMGRKSASAVITKICVRDLSKPRSFHVDENQTQLVTDVRSILDDDSIDLVVEVMGGTSLAKTVVMESLRGGKSVVTANKALIGEYLEEIQEEVRSSPKQVHFGYEAAVCGGIPIINILQSCYTGDVIHKIMGICNGTTNYMLGKMEHGTGYVEVLKEAQDLGFAEAEPSADVDGYDVQSKICILAKLAFGTTVPVKDVPCMGITQVSPVDFEYAKLLGCTIKLVGTAARMSRYGEHDGPLSVYVAPTVVPLSHLLASAREAGNAVAVTSANLGTASYTGPGAGRFPTANSIVADIMRCTSTPQEPFPLESKLDLDHNYMSPFYIRVSFRDGLGIIRTVGELAEVHGISINSILQNPITDRMAADFVIATEECKLSQVQAYCLDIEKQEFALNYPLCMPLMLQFP